MRRQVHGLPLLATLGLGLLVWLAAGGRAIDLRAAALLGLLFCTPLLDRALGALETRFGGPAGERWRAATAAAVGLMLAAALPLALGTVAGPAIGVIVLGVLTVRLLAPVPAFATVAAAILGALLLR